MTFFQLLEQNGAITTFVLWVIISFLIGLFIGTARGKANKAQAAEETLHAQTASPPLLQAETVDSGRLVAVITAAVNEYRTNGVRTNTVRINNI